MMIILHLLCFILKFVYHCFPRKFRISGFLVFSVTIIRSSKRIITISIYNINIHQHLKLHNSHYIKSANNKQQSNIRGRMIVVSQILNQVQIYRLQVDYRNQLLYSVSVINCPSSEHGVLCILIVDIVSKSALVLFTLLSARNNHFEKAPCCS